MFLRFSSLKAVSAFMPALVLLAALPATADAATIVRGDATRMLGRDLFVDNASTGGGDAQAHQPNAVLSRNDFGQLNVGTGGSRITITGVAWASPNNAQANDAETIEVRVVYLGADGEGGGGDDVVIGSESGTFEYNHAGEYVFIFDQPFTAVVDGRNTYFRVDIRPSNAAGDGSIRVKTQGNHAKVSVAGTSVAVD